MRTRRSAFALPTDTTVVAAALVASCAGFSIPARGAGPERIGLVDRSIWPGTLRSSAEFDRASKAENLAFLAVLSDLDLSPAAIRASTGVSKPHRASVGLWRAKVLAETERSLAAAHAGCAPKDAFPCSYATPSTSSSATGSAAGDTAAMGATGAVERLGKAVPREFQAWWEAAREFHEAYVAEQARLAALFPSTSSEALTHDRSEIDGSSYPDRSFLLTFDDGPTRRGGSTDSTADLLRARGVSATFFVLGDAFAARLKAGGKSDLATAYKGHCVSSHGKTHKAHPKLPSWRESIESTHEAIRASGVGKGARIGFRPPYGQRTPEQTKHVRGFGSEVVLWNVDSQDWRSGVSVGRIADRVLTLMLLKRRGIVLFHDVHARALGALPSLLDRLEGSGVAWRDCAKSD